MKLFVAYPFTDDQFTELKKEHEVIYFKDDYTEADLQEIEGIIAFHPFAKHALSDFPKLSFIQLVSAGINQVDLKALEEKGITLANARGIYSIPIGEWVVMRLLEANKRARDIFELQAQKKWEQWMFMPELTGSKIGFVGTGSLAQEAVKRLLAFHVELIGFNTDGKAAEHFGETYPLATLADHIGTLDALVLCTPETPGTIGIVNEEVLARAKSDLTLINVGRGTILDEDALVRFLQANESALAILDVFQTEPLPEDSSLWTLPNSWVSPHVSASSDRIKERLFELATVNLGNLSAGTPLRNEIDKNRGY